MKSKRILSTLLAVIMVVCMLPLTVSAMKVFVYISIEDSTIALEVEPADSIENVKQKIQDNKGISPNTINLFFNGALLNDGRTLGDYNIKNEDTIQVKLKHSHCVCGGNTNIGDHTTHDDIEFIPWDKTDSMPDTTGNYVLMNDVTISSGWKPAEGETVLCLNGYDLVYDGENTGSTIQFEQNRTLTLCDCKGTGKITHAEGSYGRGVNVGGLNSLFIMYGGNICGNNARGNAGGGVQVALNMIMYGGTISDNVSNFQGGGVDIGFVGTLTMYGGTIESNSTSGSGGGVHVSGDDANTGTFIMLGGKVTDNAAQKGGGVMLSAGDDYYANITVGGSAVIKNNTTDAEPNNLYLHYSEGRQEQQLVTIQNMTDGAEIGITMDSGKEGVFSTGGKDYTSRFFSDNGAYAVAVDGENLKLVEAYVQVGQVTLKNGEYTTDGINKTAGEPTGEGYAYYNDGVLTLNSFSYTSGGNNNAVIYSTADLTINAVGTNTIDSTEEYAISLKGYNLTIEGDVLNLAVSDAENTLTLYNDFDGTYGKLNITDVTLNIENKSDDQSYGIRCRDVLIDGSTLTVNMKKEKEHRSTGLDANGTVAIVRNSQVVIDLSEATTGSALIADGSVSISDSYVELRGDANDGTGLSFNTSYRTLDFNGGTLIISGTRDPGGAIYMYNATIELPDGDYWWRTNENDSYTKGGYTYNKSQTYIELTTSKLQNEWVSTPTIRGWIYNTEKSTPQAEAKYGTVEFKYYDADKNLLTELPDNAGTYYLKGFVLETNNYTGLEYDYVWFAVDKDEQYPPRPTGVNTTYIDTNDGKITGVDETMEYRKEGETDYTAVTGTEITGLAPGKYYVRYAEKLNYNPSPDNVITISEGSKRTATINITATLDKTYDGSAVTEPAKDNGFTYDGDGTASVKWYADNEGVKGDAALTEAPKNAGKYWIGVSATEGTTYNTVPEVTRQFEITKATPTITTPPTASQIVSGSKLENSNLTDGIASVDGIFAWETPTKEMTTTGDILEKVIFTPTDTTNYSTAECDVTVNVYRRSSGGGGTTRYTVKFETNGGTAISSKTVTRNSKLTAPDEPTQEGFIFGGWYTDKDLTEKYDFDSKVTKSFTLYAKWVEETTEPTQPTEWENPFIDVNTDDWFYDVVKEAYINGLIKGTSENTFSPNGDITREMFVTILYRAEGEPAVNKSIPFADVKADDYFANAVIWAQQNEIVKGISETEFAPNSNITREQMAAILYRYALYKGVTPATTLAYHLGKFTDKDDISEYAVTALDWAVSGNIISGKGDGILDPLGTATRAEAAAVLVRFLEKI